MSRTSDFKSEREFRDSLQEILGLLLGRPELCSGLRELQLEDRHAISENDEGCCGVVMAGLEGRVLGKRVEERREGELGVGEAGGDALDALGGGGREREQLQALSVWEIEG